MQELRGESISVVYDDPKLGSFAEEVAEQASEALNVLIDLLNFKPRHVTLVIEDTTDSYNAFAITNPHLKVALRPLFPTESELGFRTENVLYSLMLHELMHTNQLTYTATEKTNELLIAGERRIFTAGKVASVPPAWFVEGIATWIESAYGGGGRLNDAFTTGLLQSLALDGGIPALDDVSLTSYSQWPYGRARYLFGVSFIDYLVEKHSFETILDMLQIYNRGGLIGGILNDFSSAWFAVVGTELEDEWTSWQKSLKAQTIKRVFELPSTMSDVLASYASAVLSPDGQYLAWVDVSKGILVSKVKKVSTDTGSSKDSLELVDTELVLADRAPRKLNWYSNNQLVYSRTVRDKLTSFRKAFLLDIETGEERLFSAQERLKLLTPNLASGCVFAIRDVRPEPSLLVELCPAEVGDKASVVLSLEVSSVWQAPEGIHLLSIAINSQGDILLSVWQEGKADLALFDSETGNLDLLMHDAGQDLEPAWRIKASGDASIVFRSDRHLTTQGNVVFDVYELEPARSTQQKHRLTRLSRSIGGAFQPISFDDDTVIYSTLVNGGFQIASLDTNSPNRISFVTSPEVSYTLTRVNNFEESIVADSTSNSLIGFELQNYQPLKSLLPYAIQPTLSVGNVNLNNLADIQYFLSGTTFSEDITGKHSYRVSGGLNNILTGYLGGQYLFLNYTYSPTPVLTPVSQSPVDMGLSVGVWPHFPFGEGATETALGVRTFVNLKLPNDNFVSYANLSVGLINFQSRSTDWFIDASARLMISKQRRDTWDYVSDGYRSALFAAMSPSAAISPSAAMSPSAEGQSGGVWATSSYHESVNAFGLSGIGELYLQAGYNAAQPIPISTDSEFSVLGHVGLRHSINTAWRYGDGLHAIERISLEPKLRSWYDTDLHIGADIGLYFDTVVNYLAPLSVGLQVGYADDFWYSWGIRLPQF